MSSIGLKRGWRRVQRVGQRCLHTWDCAWCALKPTKPPLALWYGPPSYFNRKFLPITMPTGTPGEGLAERPSFFFLFPYGLRCGAWGIGLVDCVLLACWGFCWAAFVALSLIVIITPMLLFIVFRWPVLLDAQKFPEKYLAELSQIIDGISLEPEADIKKCRLGVIWFAFCKCFPVFRHRRSLAWHSSSWVHSFITAAYIDFFCDRPAIGLLKNGSARFFIYHCWPVWSSYAVLFALMLFQAIMHFTNRLQPMQFVMLIAVWFVFSIFFFVHELDIAARWMLFTREDISRTFPWMIPVRNALPRTLTQLESRSIALGASLTSGALTAVFLAAVGVYAK